MNGKTDGSTDTLGAALFSILKFLMLSTKLNPQTTDQISPAYAYAWSNGVYPVLSAVSLHEPVKEFFDISEDKCQKVVDFLIQEADEKRYHGFYEIEDHFKSSEINRLNLICILRYLFLLGRLSEGVLSNLLPGNHPTEAMQIVKPFDLSNPRDICLEAL
jgi:hypothetical protein